MKITAFRNQSTDPRVNTAKEQSMKALFATLLLLLLQACGTDDKADSLPAETVVAPTDSAPQYDQDCLDGKEPKASKAVPPPLTLCKTLKNGSVSSVTIQPESDQVDPATCEILAAENTMLKTLKEMEYLLCEAGA